MKPHNSNRREGGSAAKGRVAIADITRRRTGELLRGIFKLLDDQEDGLPAKVVLDQLTTLVPPNDFEASTYPKRPGVRRYEKIVRFSTINTVKAGWLEKEKGTVKTRIDSSQRSGFEGY